MDETLIDFVRVLRNAEVRVSPAEALDALHAIRAVGIGDRDLLRDALAACLAKTAAEKDIYEHCLDRKSVV